MNKGAVEKEEQEKEEQKQKTEATMTRREGRGGDRRAENVVA